MHSWYCFFIIFVIYSICYKFFLGYRGPSCGLSCWGGKTGKSCDICDCHNGADCNPITGKCECGTGWTGPKCAQPCGKDTYGINCTQRCRCENSVSCDPQSGKCKCKDGWYGKLFFALLIFEQWKF